MENIDTERTVSAPLRVAVLGAGGRVGRAVSREFVARGHAVLGVVRDERRHAGLRELGLDLAEADVTRGADLVGVLGTADVVVLAVTPFTAPPPTFDGFDEAYYEHVVRAVAGATRPEPPVRLLTIGLFATLPLTAGARVMDDADLFPPPLLPFARAHDRVLPALRRHGGALDWLIVTPPAGLGPEAAADGRGPVLARPPVGRDQATGALGHDQFARAVADQAENPTFHRAQVAVVPASASASASPVRSPDPGGPGA
ncbi:NAD(P)-binding domain-containing protein [Frankia sp. AiPs1]|uniref:NAD(P)-dependent oxidoreductase n=1 Tax=Frankia sp. AiPa1 TaxID=573492 RepID=UPI00202B6838|nr:NAD(P)H-binding protein [Frankia sp. AiPa1]MCL9761629.1 NAD(P)H-binding protein [Frankia sp. AiPa1]